MLPIRVPKAAIRAPTDRAVIWQIPGKREVVRPRFGAFWDYEMDWLNGTTFHLIELFWAKLPMKIRYAWLMQRTSQKQKITDNCASSLKPAASPRTSSGLPELIYSLHLYFWLSLSFAWCCYHWFHCFPVPATWKTCIFCPHKTPPTAFQGATLLRLLNSTSGFPFRSLSMLHRRTPPKSGQGSILLDWLNLCKVPKMIKALRPKDTKWQL